MTNEDTWSGKVAIVTGGSSGIGRATALALVARGAKVVITGRNQAKLDAVAGEADGIAPVRADSADPGLAHYAASKAALEHLTRSWALELAGSGVRVNAVAPGPVESGALTGMMGLSRETASAVEAAEAAQVPLGRRGVTADVVPWILRLGSSANAWLTGQVLTVDGGWSQRA